MCLYSSGTTLRPCDMLFLGDGLVEVTYPYSFDTTLGQCGVPFSDDYLANFAYFSLHLGLRSLAHRLVEDASMRIDFLFIIMESDNVLLSWLSKPLYGLGTESKQQILFWLNNLESLEHCNRLRKTGLQFPR